MNLLLHGLDAPQIDPGNSLRFKLTDIGERDRVDVILTNPPFGGGSPGTRFLIPMLPFLGVPLAAAYRRFPAVTLALALPSAATMLAATVTQPLLGNDATGYWAHVVGIASFEHTVATILGAGNGWGGLVPLIAVLVLCMALTVAATPSLPFSRGAIVGAGALAAWVCAALFAPVFG